jgi:hypothetical protein
VVEDFNNVQDQNLVDDDVVSQIAGDSGAPAGSVGSVVHPDDPKPASQKPPVPTAQELLGDKIDEVTVGSDEQPAPQAPPVAVPEPDIEVPTPEIAPESDAGEDKADQKDAPSDKKEEHFIAPPDDSNDDAGDDSDSGANDDSADADEDDKDDKPKLDTSHLDGGTGDDEELMDVKHEALEELSPLVNNLDLPPEQKFDTYMEILRASDDKTLVKPALEAAKAIEDDDKRAQALLDVVNEVNYLTQDHEKQ